jgi:hypothetical protein
MFTEHGAIMAATVLNSPRAVQMVSASSKLAPSLRDRNPQIPSRLFRDPANRALVNRLGSTILASIAWWKTCDAGSSRESVA